MVTPSAILVDGAKIPLQALRRELCKERTASNRYPSAAFCRRESLIKN
jgi:hypothetical protein